MKKRTGIIGYSVFRQLISESLVFRRLDSRDCGSMLFTFHRFQQVLPAKMWIGCWITQILFARGPLTFGVLLKRLCSL